MGCPEAIVRHLTQPKENWWDMIERTIKELEKRKKECKDRLDYLSLIGDVMLSLNTSIKQWLPWLVPQKAKEYSLEEIKEIAEVFLKAGKEILKLDAKLTKAHTSPEFVVKESKKKSKSPFVR